MDQAAFFLILLAGIIDISTSMDSQYYFVNKNMTWEDAQSYCRVNYIDLATIESMVDVTDAIERLEIGNSIFNVPVWIGLKRAWAWSTGNSLNYSSVPWGAYQPNEGPSQAACLLFNSMGWSDYGCSSYFPSFCYDEQSPTASKKFILITSAKTWVNAQTYCKQKYVDLAIINNTADNAAFANYTGSAWIGLISSQWSDGGFSIFRNWAPGYSESSLSNKCTAMVANNSGRWISLNCTLKMPFLCYGGSIQHFTRQYQYVDYQKTWPDAQTYCRTYYTDMATIDSINDVNSIMNKVLDYSGSLWIGLNRATVPQWGWSQGNEPISTYSNWGAGRPNGSGQCVANINNVWHDYNCTVPLYFVCYNEGTDIYIMVESNKTWQDAQSYCRSYYTDLAKIRSQWEQKQLIDLVGRGVFVWIGLFLDTWAWSDQWGGLFRNWELGQPVSVSNGCTAMMTNVSGKWTVQNCNTALPFICYGELKMMKKIIRIKLSYSGTANLNNLSMQAVILKEIENKLISQGMDGDTKFRWKVMSDGNVFVKQSDHVEF